MPSASPGPTPSPGELPIIQATMDLISWFVPLLNRLPRDHRFALGNRLIPRLYDLLEGLVAARYATAKLERLEPLNARLDLLRLPIRLLHSFQLIDTCRYEHVARLVEEVGRQLGGRIRLRNSSLLPIRRGRRRCAWAVSEGPLDSARAFATAQSWDAHLAHGHSLALRRRLFAPHGLACGLPPAPPLA